MNSERLLKWLGFVLLCVIWGSTWFAIKIGLESLPPFSAVALRFTLATLILFVVMRVRGERIPFDRSSVSLYITLAILSFSIPFALVYWGEVYIGSGLAAILFAAHPFIVAAESHLFLPNERLNPFKIIGILLGFLGVLVIFWGDLHVGGSSTGGMLAILVSSLMQGTALVIVKRKGANISPNALSLGGMLFGIVILLGMALVFEDVSRVRLDQKGILSILYLAVFGTVIAFSTYYWLLKRVEAVYLSLIALVTPVLAVVLGSLWLEESLSPRIFSGAGLVLFGILIANGKDLLSTVQSGRAEL